MPPEQTTLPDAPEAVIETATTQEPESRRDLLAATFDSLESREPEQSAAQRARDEAGRFAAKPATPEPTQAPVQPEAAPEAPKLTTWKKEYLPLHDKLAQGIPLTPDEAKKLAGYNAQRESEYSTGVSVYKDRATRLEGIEKAIEPFMPNLQRHNVDVQKWIGDLGRAHETLALGSPEQKVQMLRQVAQAYGVPMGMLQGDGQPDQTVMQLMGEIQELKGQVQGVASWRDQQDQQRAAQAVAVLEGNAEKFPHIRNEKVRGAMAQLLESGSAKDLEEAYAEAEWMVPEVRELKLSSLSQGQQAKVNQQQVIAKAKAAAVSPRSVTPSGAVGRASPTQDRRAFMSEQFDSIASGRV